MQRRLTPRMIVGIAVVALIVGAIGLKLVLAVGPSAYRDRFSTCESLKPTWRNEVFSSLPAMAPEITLPRVDGVPIQLSALRGRVVFVNFWATWCGPCVEEMPALERLRIGLEGKPFEMLAIASERSAGPISEFFRGVSPRMTVLIDDPGAESDVGPVAKSWGSPKLPETYLIDKQGVIRYYFVNERNWSGYAAQRCVQALLDE